MKFKITKEAFFTGLQQVQNVVSTRTTLPILSNVLLEADGKQLRLTTTDLDVGITGVVEADVEKGGATTLPARRLATIIRELPAQEVEVEVDEKNVASIRSGPSFFKILGLAKDEFPPLPNLSEANDFVLDQAEVLESLKKTSYAISDDETRYVLNGILCAFKDNTLKMVATDGRRLAMVEQEVEVPQSQEVEIIIPSKAVQELQRLLKQEGKVKMSVTDSQVAFELNDNVLVSKLIEGNYPNYNQVIPSETKHRLKMSRETLLQTLSRVSLLASDKSNSIKLHFENNALELMANSPDIGEATESLDVSYDGPPITVAFNPDFMMAPLKNLSEDEVNLDLIDEMSPGVFRAEGSFLYVIMPMRVSQ